MKNGYFHPINYLGDRTGSNYKIIKVPACVIKFHTTKLRAHGFSQLPSPAATSGLICTGTFYWSVSAVCGKDLIWWWPNTDQDGLPQRGPKEHAVWELSGDVLIMRAILVVFNYVKSGAGGGRRGAPTAGSLQKGGPSDSRRAGHVTHPAISHVLPSGALCVTDTRMSRGKCHHENILRQELVIQP